MKTLGIICASLGIYAYTITVGYLERGKEIATLESEKNALERDIERVNNAKIQASNTIAKIKDKIARTQEPCDCYRSPLPAGDILDWMRGTKK